MGHYRSEMGYEDEDCRDAERKAVRRAKIAAGVAAQIEQDGVAAVIADLVDALADSRVYVAQRWEHWHGSSPLHREG